jgi:hypothetical protein
MRHSVEVIIRVDIAMPALLSAIHNTGYCHVQPRPSACVPFCERRSKSALFCRHHLGDGECRSISGRPVQPVGPMVANDGWAGEPLSRPIAAEGGGRRPAFTVAASPAKLASRVDRLLAGIIRHAIVLDEVSACGTLNLCPI